MAEPIVPIVTPIPPVDSMQNPESTLGGRTSEAAAYVVPNVILDSTVAPLPTLCIAAIPPQTVSGPSIPTNTQIKITNRSEDEPLTLTAAEQLWLASSFSANQDIITALLEGEPSEIVDYSEHIFKICSILYDGGLGDPELQSLEKKALRLFEILPRFASEKIDPSSSQLYLIIERCFDIFIKIITSLSMVNLATHVIRFLTTVLMTLNYWEIYNLLRWRPAIYQFLKLIKFDMTECYARFMRQYMSYKNLERPISESNMKLAVEERLAKERFIARKFKGTNSPETDEIFGYSFDPDLFDDHDKFVLDQLSMGNKAFPRKRSIVDHKLAAHKVLKKNDMNFVRSTNYDPDVIHECHLPSAEKPGVPCLRRFSRKYELIRHQETVHSKRKKLFKCFVCVKQNPQMDPRIFTRHDTLAKHIRVNHRISGKEAKAEVAYSKKHAEIIHETNDMPAGDFRRKVKGEFEFLVNLERTNSKNGSDDDNLYDDFEGYGQSQDEDDMDGI